jgi:DNA-directed RNA polymerase alpha subunit
MSSHGTIEKVYFLGPDIGGLRKRGPHATEGAVQEFIAYWENQIQVAKDYLANGRTNRTDRWVKNSHTTPCNTSPDIVALGLSTRPFNCLYEAGIYTLEVLTQCRKSDLLKLRKMGKTSVKEVETALARLGLALRPERFEEKKKKLGE